PGAPDFPEEPEPRARSRGRAGSSAPKGKTPEKKTRGGKRKAAPAPGQERPAGTRPDPDDSPDANAELVETYCAEKWHSLCNFFVNFWNG
ncbi:fibroblast growth factor-binding protein 3, partial [Octodon degus]|uniref:Fibroblast growth factor-binding protein 3 n=1 Tax=Octodon degus TaxID=10160 RepID=A0A6P6EIV1_OCTDE